MSSNPSHNQGAPASSQGTSTTDDGPADRPAGAIEDGIVSSTADPDAPIEYDGGAVVPPGDTKPVLPPYEGRNRGTADGTPGRGENELSDNTGVSSNRGESAESSPEGGGDQGVSDPSHTPGTGRGEAKL